MSAAISSKYIRNDLPIIGSALLANSVEAVGAEFGNGSPFPHVMLDLELPRSLLTEFPSMDWEGWNSYGDGHQRGKRICSRLVAMPDALRSAIEELQSSEVLAWLEKATGIDHLISDPHLEGGGLHASSEGGILRTHTDFHRYRRLDVVRRLNLLVYLNEDWSLDDGGALQLHRKGHDEPELEIVPTFGRVVIFETSDRSPHGFMTPVAPGKTRRSIALYYYTAARTDSFDGDTNTYWLGADRGSSRSRQLAYRALQQVSRIAAVGAHMADPNRGVRDLKSARQRAKSAKQ
jgi:2OG-Fe(II) oxygenase superfamily